MRFLLPTYLGFTYLLVSSFHQASEPRPGLPRKDHRVANPHNLPRVHDHDPIEVHDHVRPVRDRPR